MGIGTFITLGIIAVLVIYFISIYNSLVTLKHNVSKAWSNIDVLLKQRHDELPKLVEEQVKAISNLQIDNVTVWESGRNADGKSSTADFVSSLVGALPPLHDLTKNVGVELPDAGAVAALDVVGVDLELRAGAGQGARGQQQVLVRLPGVGLLRVLPHEDPPVEHGTGLALENPLVELVAVAVRRHVLDPHVVVHQLLALHKVEAVQVGVAALARQDGVDLLVFPELSLTG